MRRYGSVGVSLLLSLLVMGLLARIGGDRQIFASASAPVDLDPRDGRDLVVHEWGTFTAVAGEDGEAIQWLPLGGPTDLPCFVHYWDNRQVKLGPDFGPQLTYNEARTGLKATVRMETPVLYFYTSKPMMVDVAVKFRRGMFTEWYPAASVFQLGFAEKVFLSNNLNAEASMSWKGIQLHPNANANASFPREDSPSHYYAARATDAAPVEVGSEHERFLFYRGVAGFAPPIAAKLEANGSVTVTNRGGEIPRVILFTKRGQQLGYRVLDSALQQQQEAVLDPPSLDSTFAALRQTLEQTLIAQGLYPKEATAMIDTWRDSWFEDGTRLFFIVPRSNVDAVLPLKITPTPASIARVFVGRMELITPSDVTAVQTALDTQDGATLERYGRLLDPIANRILASAASPEGDRPTDRRAQMLRQLDRELKTYAAGLNNCNPAQSLSPTAASAQY